MIILSKELEIQIQSFPPELKEANIKIQKANSELAYNILNFFKLRCEKSNQTSLEKLAERYQVELDTSGKKFYGYLEGIFSKDSLPKIGPFPLLPFKEKEEILSFDIIRRKIIALHNLSNNKHEEFIKNLNEIDFLLRKIACQKIKECDLRPIYSFIEKTYTLKALFYVENFLKDERNSKEQFLNFFLNEEFPLSFRQTLSFILQEKNIFLWEEIWKEITNPFLKEWFRRVFVDIQKDVHTLFMDKNDDLTDIYLVNETKNIKNFHLDFSIISGYYLRRASFFQDRISSITEALLEDENGLFFHNLKNMYPSSFENLIYRAAFKSTEELSVVFLKTTACFVRCKEADKSKKIFKLYKKNESKRLLISELFFKQIIKNCFFYINLKDGEFLFKRMDFVLELVCLSDFFFEKSEVISFYVQVLKKIYIDYWGKKAEKAPLFKNWLEKRMLTEIERVKLGDYSFNLYKIEDFYELSAFLEEKDIDTLNIIEKFFFECCFQLHFKNKNNLEDELKKNKLIPDFYRSIFFSNLISFEKLLLLNWSRISYGLIYNQNIVFKNGLKENFNKGFFYKKICLTLFQHSILKSCINNPYKIHELDGENFKNLFLKVFFDLSVFKEKYKDTLSWKDFFLDKENQTKVIFFAIKEFLKKISQINSFSQQTSLLETSTEENLDVDIFKEKKSCENFGLKIDSELKKVTNVSSFSSEIPLPSMERGVFRFISLFPHLRKDVYCFLEEIDPYSQNLYLQILKKYLSLEPIFNENLIDFFILERSVDWVVDLLISMLVLYKNEGVIENIDTTIEEIIPKLVYLYIVSEEEEKVLHSVLLTKRNLDELFYDVFKNFPLSKITAEHIQGVSSIVIGQMEVNTEIQSIFHILERIWNEAEKKTSIEFSCPQIHFFYEICCYIFESKNKSTFKEISILKIQKAFEFRNRLNPIFWRNVRVFLKLKKDIDTEKSIESFSNIFEKLKFF